MKLSDISIGEVLAWQTGPKGIVSKRKCKVIGFTDEGTVLVLISYGIRGLIQRSVPATSLKALTPSLIRLNVDFENTRIFLKRK